MTLLPCHRCRERGKVVVTPCDAGAAYGYVVYCDNCSGGEFEVSHGWTKEAAAEAWNEDVEMRDDVTQPLAGSAK